MNNDAAFAAAYENAVERMFPKGAPDRVTAEQDEILLAEAAAEVAASE